MSEKKKKIVIVGGGIAGLSAGIYGRLAGYDVDIYEKNQVAGGQCMGWNRKGYHIDNCIHWLTGTKEGTSLREVWETVGALDEDTEFADCESFYTSIKGDFKVTLWKDLERTKAELLRLSPEDETEIKKFVEYVKYAVACEVPTEKPIDAMGIADYIRMGASMADVPKVMKEYGSIDLEDMSERFKHPAIKAMFTDYLPREYAASSLLVSYASVASGNGEIPMGGSLAMAQRMAKRFQDLGGHLCCDAPVSRILIEKGKATGIEITDKKVVKADYVISAVDTMEMFEHLIGKKYMDKKWRSCYADCEKYPLFTAVQAAFAVERDAYHEKGTLFFECAPFETGGKKVERISVKSYEYEPGFAPTGKTVLQVNVPQFDREYLYWKGLTREEYKKQKKETVKAIEERVLTQFPGLQGHMEFLACWTPMTYERYCNAYHGAYMGFITKKGMKSFRVKGTVKGIKNLYIASQWIMAPGGLPVAVTAGKFAVWRIARKDKREIQQNHSF